MQGVFQGAIDSTTPYGSRSTIADLLSSDGVGIEARTAEIKPAVVLHASMAKLNSNPNIGSSAPVSLMITVNSCSFLLARISAARKRSDRDSNATCAV